MSVKTVDPRTLKAWLDADDAILIDVREPSENRAENIPGARLIPLNQISGLSLPTGKGKKVAIHCRTGRRSLNACEILLAQNPNLDLYNLEGGIAAWKLANLPINRSKNAYFPLDQQVQITIGSGVLLGLLLGYAVTPYFYWLSAFFGAGLLYAGLTGKCALLAMMAKMPWNR